MDGIKLEWFGRGCKTVASATCDDIKVEWENLNEGVTGDFDPNNPGDRNFLRFTVYVKDPESGNWSQADDASYCTCTEASVSKEQLMACLHDIFSRYYWVLHNNHSVSVKKLGEQLSWIDASTITPTPDRMKEICQDSLDSRAEELWHEFGDIPMNPLTERMEDWFMGFIPGTHREEIWFWFDKIHSHGVHHLLYELQ